MVQNIYGLTPLQEGMLFHSLYREENTTPYCEQMVFNIKGELDIEIFQESWQHIVNRYEIFRTIFVHKNTPTPKQVVLKAWKIAFEYHDISDREELENVSESGTLGANKARLKPSFPSTERERYFELSKKPPLRVTVLKQAPTLHQVIFTFHHILMDGWSGAIVFGELFSIYDALLKGEAPSLPLTKPYSHYIKWLKKQDSQETKAFWAEYLCNVHQATTIPQKKSISKHELTKNIFYISQEKSQQLNRFVKEQGLTLNVVVQSIWGIVLAHLNGTKDVVFGATVSGRSDQIEGIEKMVGLFINAIPVRIAFEAHTTLLELFPKVMKSSLEAQNHHHYSLADIQNLTPLKESLIQQLMVFENYPSSADEKSSDKEYEPEMVEVFNQTNYDFDITIAPSTSIEVMFKYNKFAYDASLILALQNAFEHMVDVVISSPKTTISIITLDGLKLDSLKREEEKRTQLYISSTFTAEPIEQGLLAWCERFETPLAIEFGGYNQVIQNLIDTHSPLYRDKGVNALLIRFEDVLRFMNLDEIKEKQNAIRKNYQQIVSLLEKSHFTIATFIPIFKPQEGELFDFLTELYGEFEQKLKAIKNIYPIDFRTLDSLYQVEEVFDEKANEVGHIPFGDGYYFAMGSFLFRKIYAYYNPHFKVIALDCDNTLWGGVVGEDGVLGIDVSGGYLALQRFVLARKEEGFLIVLSSKNNERDVWELFEKNEKMLLQKEDIVHAKINWQPKSQNLKAMAKELNLGLNSFIFIDDNPLECSEMIQNAPEVLALPLPKDSNLFERFLAHTWAMDKLQVTQEDKSRTQMYRAETQRTQSSETLSMDKFLSSLGLKIYMNKMLDSQLERVAQLTQRTNQFNVSTIRRSESDIKTLLNDENIVCWTVNVADKFGDYGLVGVVISQKREKTLFMETFLMSCRVLGRGVEKSILAGLKRYALEHGLERLEVEFYPTQKNRPALEFIKNHNFVVEEKSEQKILYGQGLAQIAKEPSFVEFSFDTGKVMESKEPKHLTKLTESEAIATNKTRLKPSLPDSTLDFEFTFLEHLEQDVLEQLTHKKFYEPLTFHNASDAQYLIKKENQRESKGVFVAPQTKSEIRLASIYKELLNLTNVGIKESFFELGGHSLTATRLLSRIEQHFQVELGLKDIFANPSIEKLLERMEQKEQGEGQKIPLASIQEHYPLSNAQKRVWLIEQMGGGVAYNMPIALHLEGKLDIERLNRALNETIAHHESLRTAFIVVDDEPRQRIVPTVSIALEKQVKEMEWVQEHIKHDAHQPFDLTTPPLLKVELFKVKEDERKEDSYVLYFKMHHIISDGWSLGVLTQEISQRYRGEDIAPLEIQYKDYTLWQQGLLNSNKMKKAQTYWLDKFQGELTPLNFPTDAPRPKEQSFDGSYVGMELTKFIEPINALTQQSQTTLFMFLTAITKLILARYTMQGDIILGCPISGREHIELERQIGFYANTLALRDIINFDAPFETLLQQVKKTVLDGDEHQAYPFEKLIDELAIPRDISRGSLFDFAISLNQNYNQLELDGLKLSPLPVDFEMAQFDITFNFYRDEEQLGLNLNYNSHLFNQESMQRLLNHIQNAIETVLISPQQPIKDIEFLTTSEKQKQCPLESETLVPNTSISRFTQQVKATPNATAVSFNEKSLSYATLDRRSNRVANYLIEQHGIVEGKRVAFWLPRSELTVVALLGILKANATFLPLHSTLPEERVNYIIDDAKAKLLTLEEMTTAIRYENEKQPIISLSLQESAYIIYTSGTTGNPKGVEVSEQSLLNLCDWYIKDFEIGKSSKSLLMIPISFDASIKNILAPLLVGGEVVVAKDMFDPHTLLDTIQQKEITLINCVPSAFRAILDIADDSKAFASLRHLALGGERLNLALFSEFYKESGVKLFNLYGPTEACDITTCYQIMPEDMERETIPIGQPIANSEVFILDRFGNTAPFNVVGELMIGGVGLAKGYLNNEQMTQQNFITHPTLGRLYRSGDLAYRLPDGNIIFMGREDEQVKVNGNRVELGEIEQTLLALDDIAWAMVLLHDNHLVAYIQTSQEIKSGHLRSLLQEKLPSYMIPSSFIAIKTIPLTQNGKVDKRRLLEMPIMRESDEEERDLSTFEKAILSIFEEVLGKKLSLSDNFFEVGGESLMAVKVIGKINRSHNKALRLSMLFEHQRLGDFINFMVKKEDKISPKEPYHIFNPDATEAIFLFPALMDLVDSRVSAGKLATLLPEYKIYSFDFWVSADYIAECATMVGELEEEFVFLGYSSGGNIAFEVMQKLLKKPQKLVLLDSWRIVEQNSLAEQGVEAFFDSHKIELEPHLLESYMGLINSMVNQQRIGVDIVLIKSEKEHKNEALPRGAINQSWNLLTTERFQTYQGFGVHLTMLKDDALINNGGVIHQILSKERSI